MNTSLHEMNPSALTERELTVGATAAAPVPARCRILLANGKHNAFPYICRWNGELWIAYREGIAHGSDPAQVVVLRSRDGQTWSEAFRINHGYDSRDPNLIADGQRLLIYWVTRSETGVVQSFAAECRDGRSIGPVHQVHHDNYIIWRPILHQGVFYSTIYTNGKQQARQLDLLRSDDGLNWQYVSTIGKPPGLWSETAIGIGDDGVMTAWLRLKYSPSRPDPCHALVFTAPPPYTQWTQAGSLPFRIEGPGVTDIAGKTYLFTRAFNSLGSAVAMNVHVMLDPLTPHLHCSIPAMRDCAYGYGVEHEGQMLLVFYCTVPDGVHLYLAEIPLMR